MSGKEKNDGTFKKEEDCACYADNRTRKSCPPAQNVTHPLRYYEFTQEEMKALEECDRESFYKRCLPFSTIFATATYAAIRSGYLRRNPHFGVFPKVTVAVIIGHFYGRFSYIPICDRKLRMKLSEGSYLGKMLRKYHLENNPPPLIKK